MKKENYETPVTEVLELRFEGIVCESPNGDREGYEYYNLG